MVPIPPDESWVAWGNIQRQGLSRGGQAHPDKGSKFHRHWISTGSCFCVARITLHPGFDDTNPRSFVFFGLPKTHLKVEIVGGSDAPRIQITLRHEPTKQVATLAFPSWTRDQPGNSATRRVNPYPAYPAEGRESFSMHLVNLSVRRHEEFPQEIIDGRPWKKSDAQVPLLMEWDVQRNPVGICLHPNLDVMDEPSAQLFRDFSECTLATRVQLWVRGHGGFLETWSYFSAQPAPTPPPWWRYSTYVEPNQRILENLDPLEPGTDLFDHHCDPRKQNAIVSMPAFTRPIDEREYEVFVVGALLRESAAQVELYDPYWNRRYAYELRTFNEFDDNLYSERTFLVFLQLNYRADPNAAPSLPDVGAEVIIREEDLDFAGSVQSIDQGLLMTCLMTMVRGPSSIILSDRHGYFRFGKASHGFVQAQKSIQNVMWFESVPGVQSWLKCLLLAHENQAIQRLTLPPINPEWRQFLPPLNDRQEEAITAMCHVGPDLADIVTLVQGPPGCGKSLLIGMCVIDCWLRERKCMVVAETKYAVGVCAEVIQRSLNECSLGTEGVYLLDPSGAEGLDQTVELIDPASPWGALLGPQSNPPPPDAAPAVSQRTRLGLLRRIESLLQPQPLSLTAHILAKLSTFDPDFPEGFLREEVRLLGPLFLARRTLQSALTDEDEATSAYQEFQRRWKGAQEYYIQHSRCIIVTAASSMMKILRHFRPATLIIDEAAQLTEFAAAATLARFRSSTTKVNIIGDHKQKDPYVGSEAELAQPTRQSLFERLLNTGVPVIQLNTQFRMHPHISHTVSTNFYGGQVMDDPSAFARPADAIWERFVAQSIRECVGRHSIFIDVGDTPLYNTRKNPTYVNPAHLRVVAGALERLRAAGARDHHIAVFTFYRGQLRLHRAHPTAGDVKFATVDGSQEQEYNYVILDLVTPGGQPYPLGFLTDVKRICVALSRAKIGMLIIGNKDMAQQEYSAQDTRTWERLIHVHQKNAGLANRVPDAQGLAQVMEGFNIPGTLYELTPRRPDK